METESSCRGPPVANTRARLSLHLNMPVSGEVGSKEQTAVCASGNSRRHLGSLPARCPGPRRVHRTPCCLSAGARDSYESRLYRDSPPGSKFKRGPCCKPPFASTRNSRPTLDPRPTSTSKPRWESGLCPAPLPPGPCDTPMTYCGPSTIPGAKGRPRMCPPRWPGPVSSPLPSLPRATVLGQATSSSGI